MLRLAGVLVVVGIAVIAAADDGVDLPFRVTTKRNSDRVEVISEKDKTTFSIQSPIGISEAVVERTDEKWPETVTLRLRLKGLESLRVSSGQVSLDAAVSSHTDDKQRVRLWKDGKEDLLLDSASPLWMDIRMIGGDGKPTKALPLKDGYFEMKLPEGFFKGNPKSISVTWIDFFRN